MKRGKKATINTAMGLLEEFVSIICGLILPRLILSAFGSKYNGLTTSITQFLSCAILLRSGIGGATRAALYKPIANHDKVEFDSIIRATDLYLKKIGFVLLGLIICFATIYPFFVSDEFEYFFTFSLFVIIGLSSFAQTFFGITYLIVLQADQKIWVSTLSRSVCLILNVIIAAFLIRLHCSIHMVKLGSAAVFVAYPVVLSVYVKKHYQINAHAKPNNAAIAQRWDALWQQVSDFVSNNTGVMILTVFSNMLEVSVYSIYNIIINGIKKTVQSFSNGLEAAFGNMIAKNEERALRQNFGVIETLVYDMSTIVCVSATILILDFVKLYTHNVTDVDYIRPTFACTIILAQYFNGVRIPYQLVVQAAGHYKQTKKAAILEPIINITVSVLLVIKFGLVGVAIGTFVATLFRTIQYSYYMSHVLIKRNALIVAHRVLLSFAEAGLIIVVFNALPLPPAQDFTIWVVRACVCVVISVVIVSSGSFLFFRNDVKNLIVKVRNVVGF